MSIKCIRKNFIRGPLISLFLNTIAKNAKLKTHEIAFEITYVCALLSRIHLSRQ